MPDSRRAGKTGKVIYPCREWEVVEESFTIENNLRNETIFSLSNGYVGMRGNFEEGYRGPEGTGLNGTYVNGFYESEYIKYGETAYGFAEKSQTMLNVTDGKTIRLFVGDEEFNLLEGCVSEYERVLSLKDGLLRRGLTWTSPKGRKIRLEIERLVSLSNRHLIAISYTVTPVDFGGTLTLLSALDGNVTNLDAGNDPRVGSGLKGRVLFPEDAWIEGTFGMLVQRTKNTGFSLACAMDHRLDTRDDCTVRSETGPSEVKTIFEVQAESGKPVRLVKYIAYASSMGERDKPADIVRQVLEEARLLSFDTIKKAQREYLDDFWYRADISIKGDPALQQSIRVNAFHLLQAAGKDGRTNIAAKGLTGEGYEGHYFWDTEIYILPFFLHSFPEIGRKLLEYRYGILEKARERARQMSHAKGALFPWRTIGGEECSAYFPAGTAQYHIDADIAFAVKKYMEATGDQDFLIKYGAEIVFETARLWADLGCFDERRGGFCINTVTGPDEYSALVNNNCYTNLMARENLLYAFETVRWMREHTPAEYSRLADKISLGPEEPEYWKKAADGMFVPYDERLGIYLQDDSFLDRKKWDFENTPKENYPLLLHYHPLVIYRHQVCKQADLVLLLYLLGDRFTKEEKRINYGFYEKVTTHDSSLSTCIFSIEASETGDHEKAYEYFMETARMDLDDTHGNTKDGIHAANMAGTWQCIVNGFAGMRVRDGVLRFAPYLPASWEEYSFKVAFRDRLIRVKVDKSGAVFELLKGADITVMNSDEPVDLSVR